MLIELFRLLCQLAGVRQSHKKLDGGRKVDLEEVWNAALKITVEWLNLKSCGKINLFSKPRGSKFYRAMPEFTVIWYN